MRRAAIHLAEVALVAFVALAAIQPAIALPMTNGSVGFIDNKLGLEDTGNIIFTTFSRIYPVTVSINFEDLTFLGQPKNLGFAPMAASLNIRINGVIFSFRQAKTGQIPQAGPLPLPIPEAGPLALPLPEAGPLPLPLPEAGPLALLIPEPGSLALLSSALVGFGVFRRQRRNVA